MSPSVNEPATLLGSYTVWLRDKGYAGITVERYRGVYKRWGAWCELNGVETTKATADDVKRWLSGRRADVSSESVRHDMNGLCAFYDYLEAQAFITGNPAAAAAPEMLAPDPAKRRVSPLAGVERGSALEVDAAAFAAYLMTTGRGVNTAKTYVYSLSLLWRWAEGRNLTTRDLLRPQLEVWLLGRLEEAGQNTIRRNLSAIFNFYEWLVNTGQRVDNPAKGVRFKREQVTPTRPFSEAEVAALLGACDNSRDRGLLYLLLSTGARITEMTDIQIGDIDWKAGRIKLNGKGSKQRWVSPPPAAFDYLQFLVGSRTEGPLFLTNHQRFVKRSLTAHQARKVIYDIASRAGVESAHPHRFRATFATFFINMGGELDALQSVLGHSSIETTARYVAFKQTERGLEQMQRFNVLHRFTGQSAPEGS